MGHNLRLLFEDIKLEASLPREFKYMAPQLMMVWDRMRPVYTREREAEGKAHLFNLNN